MPTFLPRIVVATALTTLLSTSLSLCTTPVARAAEVPPVLVAVIYDANGVVTTVRALSPSDTFAQALPEIYQTMSPTCLTDSRGAVRCAGQQVQDLLLPGGPPADVCIDYILKGCIHQPDVPIG